MSNRNSKYVPNNDTVFVLPDVFINTWTQAY